MRPLALLVLAAGLAAAAPVPSAVDPALAKKFGTPTDPDKDCKFKLTGDTLTIAMPAAPHTLTIEKAPKNAPRILKEATGPFTLQVRVKVEFPDDPKSALPNADPDSGAGLIVWADEQNYVCLERVHQILGGKRTTCTDLHTVTAGVEGGDSSASRPHDPNPVYLRIDRGPDTLRAFVRTSDFSDWQPVGEAEFKATGAVKVGVFATHNAGHPVTATFEKYEQK